MVSGINSTNNDGLSSRLAEMQDKFKSMDTDGDGKVSKDEFLAGFKNNQAKAPNGPQPSGPPPNGTPQSSDAKSTKSSESTKSTSSMNTSSSSSASKTADAVFSDQDTNGDGYISQSEYESFLQKIQQNMIERLKYYNSSSASIQKIIKSTEKTDTSKTNINDTFASFKNDLKQLLEKYDLYNNQGSKSDTNVESVLDANA
jgi:Ca2+-binding EF-hand superfamily protein